MKQLKPWLLILLVFCAGFAGGVVVTRGVIRHAVRQAVGNPDYARDKIERRLAWKLGLDTAQRARVHDILVNTQHDLRSLRAEFQPRFAVIMAGAQTNIAAALSPAQQKRFEEFLGENRQLWQPK
jgi:hypothetical protein